MNIYTLIIVQVFVWTVSLRVVTLFWLSSFFFFLSSRKQVILQCPQTTVAILNLFTRYPTRGNATSPRNGHNTIIVIIIIIYKRHCGDRRKILQQTMFVSCSNSSVWACTRVIRCTHVDGVRTGWIAILQKCNNVLRIRDASVYGDRRWAHPCQNSQ